MPRPRILDPETVRALYESGMTQAEIGRRFGVNKRSVHMCMVRNGIPGRKRGPQTDPATVARIRDMADRGGTVRAIGAVLGCSNQAVSEFLRRHGIAPSYGIARVKGGAVASAAPSASNTTPHTHEAEPITTHHSLASACIFSHGDGSNV